MHLRVVGGTELLYEGYIYGLKGEARDGAVTCLDHHDDFLTILNKGQLEVFLSKEKKSPHLITLQEESILFIENNRAVLFH
mgnify:CR=1 FL=1